MAKDVTNNGAPLGRDGVKALVKDLRTMTPDFKLTIDTILLRIDGGLVPCWVSLRTHGAQQPAVSAN